MGQYGQCSQPARPLVGRSENSLGRYGPNPAGLRKPSRPDRRRGCWGEKRAKIQLSNNNPPFWYPPSPSSHVDNKLTGKRWWKEDGYNSTKAASGGGHRTSTKEAGDLFSAGVRSITPECGKALDRSWTWNLFHNRWKFGQKNRKGMCYEEVEKCRKSE